MQLRLPACRTSKQLAGSRNSRFAINSLALREQYGQVFGTRRLVRPTESTDDTPGLQPSAPNKRFQVTPVRKLVSRIVTNHIAKSMDDLKHMGQTYEKLAHRFHRRKLISAWEQAFKQMVQLGGASENNHIAVFRSGDDVFAHLWNEIFRAKKEIILETYIFEPDRIGLETLDRLRAALQRGVQVTIVLDSFGSMKLYDYHLEALKSLGAKVHVYNPVGITSLTTPRRLFFRNHQKACVIDNRVAFVGGMNVNEDYCSLEFGGNGRFRDTHARLEGPAVADIKASIFKSIKDLSPRFYGEEELDDHSVLPVGASELSSSEPLYRIPKTVRPSLPHVDKFLCSEYVPDVSSEDNSDTEEGINQLICPRCPPGIHDGIFVQVLQSWRRSHLRKIQKCLRAAIRRAQHEILITNPYFMPPISLKKALTDAAKRGVVVKILTCGPKSSDVPFMALGAQHLYSHFLNNGVQIYEYQNRILHAKSVVVDRIFSTIGSLNFDGTSEHRNLELNLAMLDTAQATELSDHFWADMSDAREITKDDLQNRSVLNRGVSYCMYSIQALQFRLLDGCHPNAYYEEP